MNDSSDGFKEKSDSLTSPPSATPLKTERELPAEVMSSETPFGTAKGECRHILGRCLGGILGLLIGVALCGFVGYCICVPLRQPGEWGGAVVIVGTFAGFVIGSTVGPIAGVLIGIRLAEKAAYRKSGEVPAKHRYRRFLGTWVGGVLGWGIAFVLGLLAFRIATFLPAGVLWIIGAMGPVAGAIIGSLLTENP